jgi:hypothetical protein
MPDKEIMLRIKQHEDERPWTAMDEYQKTLLDALDHEPGAEAERLATIALLAFLVDDWRATAELYDRAKLKGAQSTYIVPLRHAAAELDKVIKGLEQQRPVPPGQLRPTHADAGLDEPVHQFTVGAGGSGVTCTAMVERDGSGDQCGRYASHPAHRIETPTERPGLDALIAEARSGGTWDASVGVHVPDNPEARRIARLAYNGEDGPEVTDLPHGSLVLVGEQGPEPVSKQPGDVMTFPGQVSEAEARLYIGNEDVTAYLRGDIDDLPGTDPGPSTVRDQTEALAATFDMDEFRAAQNEEWARDERAAQQATFAAREEGGKMPEAQIVPPVPLLGQPGDAGAGYGPTYAPPGGVPMTFAELMTPVPAAVLPPHLSHSQIGTILDCPTKYRAQRLGDVGARIGKTSLEQIPEWAQIGGRAFHAVVEAFERFQVNGRIGSPLSMTRDAVHITTTDMIGGPWDMDCEGTWRTAFDDECQKIEASSPVPRSRWRASKQGSEGETWWNANGPEMIRRYLAARPAEPTATLAQPHLPGAPLTDAIELELKVQVPGPYGLLPYQGILDRVTLRLNDPAMPRDNVLVIRDYKTGATMPSDTSQLGEYANVLRLIGVPEQVKIVGTFFNARKGTWTPEVDLLAEHTPEWFSYHVASGHAAKLALTTGPTAARPSSYCGGCPVRWACPIKGVKA